MFKQALFLFSLCALFEFSFEGFSSTLFAENYVMASPKVTTSRVRGEADDCAIWFNRAHPKKSVIFGNDETLGGGIYSWDLQGNPLNFLSLDYPINLDLRQNLEIDGQKIDLLVTGQSNTGTLKFYSIRDEGKLIDISSLDPVQVYNSQSIYGLSLYQSRNALFIFISFKGKAPIEQYEVIPDGEGRLSAQWVRSLGYGEIESQVEGMVVDDKQGFLYASDELQGVLKFDARIQSNGKSLKRFALEDEIEGDREGLAIMDSTQSCLILSSQGNHSLKIYNKNEPNELLKHVWLMGVEHTSGLAACSKKIEDVFPYGFIVCHNQKGRNFALFAWEDIMPEVKVFTQTQDTISKYLPTEKFSPAL